MEVRLQSRCSASADALTVAGFLVRGRETGLATDGRSMVTVSAIVFRSYCVAVGYSDCSVSLASSSVTSAFPDRLSVPEMPHTDVAVGQKQPAADRKPASRVPGASITIVAKNERVMNDNDVEVTKIQTTRNISEDGDLAN